jgi:hypothetical protein
MSSIAWSEADGTEKRIELASLGGEYGVIQVARGHVVGKKRRRRGFLEKEFEKERKHGKRTQLTYRAL